MTPIKNKAHTKNNKQKNKNLIYNHIIQELDDYYYCKQVMNRKNYCSCELCDIDIDVYYII